MPWCPNCRMEYREGYKTCSDCQVDLVDDLESMPGNTVDDDDYADAADGIEAENTQSCLSVNRLQLLEKIAEKERRRRLVREGGRPWCPNCGAEYRHGFKVCIDCNVELITGSEPVERNNGNDDGYAGEARLLSVTDPFEADMIEALLSANEIPVLRKLQQAGGYLEIYMGTTVFGVDLYVPAKLLEKARDIVENSRGLVKDNGRKITIEEQNYRNKRRIRGWIIILFIIPGLFWIAITGLFYVYWNLAK